MVPNAPACIWILADCFNVSRDLVEKLDAESSALAFVIKGRIIQLAFGEAMKEIRTDYLSLARAARSTLSAVRLESAEVQLPFRRSAS
jgi:hypothetical protein